MMNLIKFRSLVWLLMLPLSWAATAQAQTTNGLLREVYDGVSDVTLASLLSLPSFPDYPTSSGLLSNGFEAPTNVADYYGQRLRGYVIPPAAGNYVFWIASDDNSALYLSTDEQPANKVQIASVNSWTPPRNWSIEPNQQSAPIRLEAGRAYYVEALMAEASGDDNLAVKWQLPSGVEEEPIPAARLYPWGTSFTAPAIAVNPTNTSDVEGAVAAFQVGLSSIGSASFQWQRNSNNIAGANSPSYLLAPVTLADDGARFRCVIANSKGSVTSTEAVLTVLPDLTAPFLVSLLNLGHTNLTVTFSEPMEVASSIRAANYLINNGIIVNGAALSADGKTAALTTSPLVFGTPYTVTVSSVRDRAATPNTIAPGLQMSFTAVEYTPLNLGNPPRSGSFASVTNGFNLTGDGTDIGGTADQCFFSYQQRTGDFDVQVRVQSIEGSDAWAKAGLMARDTLEANSRFAATVATPSMNGCSFLSRSTVAGNSTAAGFLPVNYPASWLRLKRAGNSFTGYASLDGQLWSLLGSVSLSLPATIYFGMAIASHNDALGTTAQFRELGNVLGGTIGTPQITGEPLGPSTRRGGLVISEIMYHPAARADGRKLEFVEIYNAQPFFEDLSGYRLTGALDYTFPPGTVLPAGAFLVVARVPEDIRNVYGISHVMGGYPQSLPNDAGTIRLRNRAGAVLLEAHYDSRYPWPAAADGAGHSLVLARPSYGEGHLEAWAASEVVGGSPGTVEAVRANPYRAVLINEFLAHTDDPAGDYIELYNHGNQPVDLSGCFLSDDPATNKFQIPAGTLLAARGFVVFTQTQLGFGLSSAGETLYLLNPDQTRVIDALRFGPQANGVSSGRYPDGAAAVRELAAPTPGAPNGVLLVRDIVINEIMYDSILHDDNDEYVELYNRGTNTVDLSQWRFTDGISYTFPNNTLLAAGGYLVVAKNAAHLMTNYPNLNSANTLGDYGGALANGGDHLALAMPEDLVSTNANNLVVTNRVYVVVNEVRYHQGGRWGRWAAGGGSSLELIDPRGDNRQPSNWADSDESAKSSWSTVEFTGVLDNGNGGYPADALQVLMLDTGECLLDSVEVFRSGSTNLVANTTFEAGVTGWFFQGNHNTSSLENTGGYAGGRCLHIRAQGRGDTGANRIRCPLRQTLNANETATLRAKVRWLRGSRELLLRLHGNWLEAAGTLSVPTNLGTPGAPNSRSAANAGPAIYEVTHTPILPAASQPVVVTARVHDGDGISALKLTYRVDPSASGTALDLVDDGTRGDAVAGDGLFSATIPGQPANTLVAFYVQATDNAPIKASTRFPSDAPTRECLVRFGESQPAGNFGAYRIWMTQATLNTWSSREKLNNTPLDVTFVYGNSRVIYNAGALYAGSPFLSPGYDSPVGSLCGYVLAMPEDDLFLGVTDLTLDWPIRDNTQQLEQIAFWMADQLGVPSVNRRFVHLYVNGNHRGTIYEDCTQPNGDMVGMWFPDDSGGDLYKIDDWFEFDDAAAGFSNVDATLQKFTTTGGAKKLARYRWNWRKRAVKSSASDYRSLFALVDSLNASNPDDYTARVESQVDVDKWTRAFAIEHIVCNWDSYGYRRGKNMYTYKPQDGKWVMMMWDIDFLFSDSTASDLFYAGDPTMQRFYNFPPFGRAYYRALNDAANGPLLSSKIGPVMDAKFAALTANGINAASPAAAKAWIEQRRLYVLQQVASANANFAITSNNGQNFNTNRSLITLTGRAPVSLKTIEVNGMAYPITWTTLNTWSMRVPLASGSNRLTLQGFDYWGEPVSTATTAITINNTGAVEWPQNFVVINEIMYHPAVPEAEFVEIFNNSATTTFDLSWWRLNGADFTFPGGTLIAPQQYLVVAKNRLVFAATYDANLPVVGEFAGQLDHGGETLSLVNPGSTSAEDVLIDQVAYRDQLPWPEAADGFGPSLQLVDPAQDNRRAGNWAAAATNAPVRFTPGAANSVRSTLPAFPLVWLNEVQAENVNGPTDQLGEHDPWLELYNSGTNAVDLSGYYLSDSFTNLTRWSFPANAAIDPGQFVVVWADGETNEATASQWHTSFHLSPGTGSVALSRLQNGSPAVMDYLNYKNLSPGRSYGDYPDGQPHDRQVFHYVTPAGTNNPASMPVDVYINEWMANNTRTLADPADGQFEDWFELYNAGTNRVDLTGYRLTDELTNTTKFVIPAGTVIEPAGYLLVWADQDTSQNNATNRDLHADFKLSQSGEVIGLFAPDGTLVDSIAFGAQTNDISEGRWPDGAASSFFFMNLPTPGSANVVSSTNRRPVLTPIGNKVVTEGTMLTFQVSASDPDLPQQILTFSLDPGAPAGAAVAPATGAFTWTPSEAQGPGTNVMTLRVSDDGVPSASDARTFTVVVREVNSAPVLTNIPNQTLAIGATLSLPISAQDADLPPNQLTYSLAAGAPAGAVINATNGLFTWTPAYDQALSTNRITMRVTDNGSPSLSATNTFTVIVNPPASSWQYVSLTGTASASVFYIYLNSPGDLYLDDLMLVPGDTPGVGTNALANGDFESALSGAWTVSTNHADSAIVTNVQHAGKASLHVIATSGGTTRASSIFQDITPALVQNAPYTLSFWYLPGTNANTLTLRLSGFGINSTNDIVPLTNRPPILAAIATQTVKAGQKLSFTVPAFDLDLPPQTLTYRLDPGAPTGASLNATNGLFSWTPLLLQQVPSGFVYLITVRVTDNGTPSLSSTRTFMVVVERPEDLKIQLVNTAAGTLTFNLSTIPGKTYQIQYKNDLSEPAWIEWSAFVASGTASTVTNLLSSESQRFFRVKETE